MGLASGVVHRKTANLAKYGYEVDVTGCETLYLLNKLDLFVYSVFD